MDKSRKGGTFVDGKSPMDYMKILFELQGFNEQRLIINSGNEEAAEEYMRKDAEFDNMSYEEYVRALVEEFEEFDDDYLGGRKGSCGKCERPENLGSISSRIISGFKRSIGEPSRKGAQAFATGNSGKLMSDVKGFINNDTVSTKLQKTFGTEDQRNQAIIKEHNNKQAKIDRQNKVNEIRNGSRKGTVPHDVLTTIKNSVKVDGIEYDFTSTRNILESQGYSEFEIDDFIDDYMDTVM